MIISHKHKFIFIKTLKTAGTSIEVFLSKHCGEDDIVTPINPMIEGHNPCNYKGLWNPINELIQHNAIHFKTTFNDLKHRRKFYNHISARKVMCRVSNEIWNSYFKFCVERNPWDKALSHYHMLNTRWEGGDLTFDQCIERKMLPINYRNYTDKNDKILVDKVLKYEFLNEGLSGIFKELNIPFEGDLGIRAKSEYRKDRRPYQEVYTRKQKEFIEKAFSKEIEMHGYSF